MESDNQKDEVVNWLKKAPFDDPQALQSQPGFSYQAWFEEGRSLPRVRRVLVDLLEEEDPQNPSGNGERIAYALAFVGDKRAVSALLASLESKDAALRAEAVFALGRLGNIDIAPTLSKLLEDEEEETNVRANACIAVGRVAAPDAEGLLKRMGAHRDPFLRSCAREGLRLLAERPDGTELQ